MIAALYVESGGVEPLDPAAIPVVISPHDRRGAHRTPGSYGLHGHRADDPAMSARPGKVWRNLALRPP